MARVSQARKVTVSLQPRLRKALERRAAQHGWTMSETIRCLLELALELADPVRVDADE